MALLRCKNPYDFENPARRVYREGGEIFAGGAAKAKAVGEWVDTKGESTLAARALAEDLNKQLDAIREGTRKDLVKLYVDVFALDVPSKETLSMTAVVSNEPKYDKKGLLEVLAMNSKLLESAFANPDIRLLAYANVYKNFKAKGMDANYLPKNATVWMTAGEVFVKYTVEGEEKTISSLLFPWDIYDEALAKLPEVRAQDAAERARRLEEHPEERAPINLGVEEDTSDTSSEVTPEEDFSDVAEDVRELLTREAISTLQVKSYELERAARELETVKTEYIGLLTTEGGLNEDARGRARELRLQIMQSSRDISETAETFLGLSTELRARPDFDVRLDGPNLDATEKTLTNVLSITNGTLAESSVYSVDERKAMLQADWIISMEMLDSRVVGGDIYVTRTEGPELSPRSLVITNDRTGEKYTIQAVLPTSEEDLPFLFTDPDVKTTVTNAAGELQTPPSDVNPDIFSLGMYYADVLEKSEVKSKKDPESAGLEKEPRPNKKKALEVEMDALFTGVDGTGPDWKKVNQQYKKMVDSLADTRIRALDHYRGSEAAANLGDIEEAIRLLEVAKKNAGDGTYEASDAETNINALKRDYGLLKTPMEQTNRWVEFTPSSSNTDPYQKAALAHLTAEFQRYGFYEGYAPVGTYNIGGKTYTVESASRVVPTTPAAPEATAKDARTAAADALELTTRFSQGDIDNMNDRYTRIRGNEDLRALLTQFQDGDFSYLSAPEANMPDPNPDGTVVWTVSLETAEGEKFEVKATGAVDLSAVDTYLAASEAMGVHLDRASLIKYLAFRQVSEDFKAQLRATREDSKLNQKYMAYAERTNVGETYSEQASAAAEKLDISLRLDPRTISMDALTYENNRDAIVDSYKANYPNIGSTPFLKEVYRRVNVINPDGSGLWHTEYELPDGTDVIIRVETDVIDAQAVADYVEAQKVLGKEFNKESLIKYLGYVQIMQAYKEAWEDQRAKFGIKYAEYQVSAKRETRVVAPAPAAAPTAAKGSGPIDFKLDEDEDVLPLQPSLVVTAPAVEDGKLHLRPGTYKDLEPTLMAVEDPYTGLASIRWDDGTFFQGELKNSVPHGIGLVSLGGANETLGPVNFVDGRAVVEVNGIKKTLTWNSEISEFNISE